VSIIQARGTSHYIISDKFYVSIMLQKFRGATEKMKKNYDEKKKMLLGSFCFISSQVP
jgi:hypothetical protein